mmetsp:Transcript_106059/g.310122  ORF Transcript_106059/g.310122 Transcript_106059/m.310122 type:complete len:96 (-) Transcript_106059:2-289(-)
MTMKTSCESSSGITVQRSAATRTTISGPSIWPGFERGPSSDIAPEDACVMPEQIVSKTLDSIVCVLDVMEWFDIKIHCGLNGCPVYAGEVSPKMP